MTTTSQMTPETKKWWQSKTLWSAAITIITVILKANGVEIPEGTTETGILTTLLFNRLGKKSVTL